jgi:hypothetical protein
VLNAIKLIAKPKPPEILYHYTNQQGLIGIISNGELWASKIRYMNDSSEYVNALSRIKHILEQRNTPGNENARLFDAILDDLNNMENIHIFSCCFTENGNILSQWRGYGGSSTGYSIGFESTDLLTYASDNGFLMVKCVYDSVCQLQIFNSIIDEGLENIKRGSYSYKDLVGDICTVSSFMKNESFHEECEWRLISLPKSCMDSEFQFRTGLASIIPYYLIKLRSPEKYLNVKEVVCGPSPYPDLNTTAVMVLLRKYGYKENVFASPISYRRF